MATGTAAMDIQATATATPATAIRRTATPTRATGTRTRATVIQVTTPMAIVHMKAAVHGDIIASVMRVIATIDRGAVPFLDARSIGTRIFAACAMA